MSGAGVGEEDQLMGGVDADVHDGEPQEAVAPAPRRRQRRPIPTSVVVKRSIRAGVAEFVGTFILCFLTLAAAHVGRTFDSSQPITSYFLIYMGMVYGMTYASVVYSLSFDGPGNKADIRQLNPALTLALVILGRIKWVESIIYILAQMAGAWVSYAITPLTLPTQDSFHKLTLDSAGVSHQLIASCFVSFIFILAVILTLFGKQRVSIRQDDASLAVIPFDFKEQKPQTQHEISCLIVLALSVACAAVVHPFTFDFSNPVIAMGISYARGTWSLAPNIGPFIGAIVATLFAKLCDIQMDALKDLYAPRGVSAAPGGPSERRRRSQNEGQVQSETEMVEP